MKRAITTCVLLLAIAPRSGGAQPAEPGFELGAAFAAAASGEFDGTDVGASVRFGWRPLALVGAEAEIGFYPGDFAGDPTFSRGRIEGLFGVTAGPAVGPARLFARVRPGFVAFRQAPEPFGCIAIFPPPLACRLAGGETVFALDLGGGVEWFPGRGTFLRVDAGDRMLRYPGPVLDAGFHTRAGAFTSHDVRFAVGGGIRF